MGLDRRDTFLTLIGIMLALFLAALDQTIVATALPRIVEDLSGVERYAWVATSYLLASTVLVPIYGKLADLVSRKAIELWAIGIFLFGSVLCGLSGEFGALPLLGDGMTQLIVFRAIQGVGAAGLMGMAFIIIADLFPPSERGKYQGYVGGTFALASVLGPVLGGFLTDHGGSLVPGIAGWRWVFYVNIPFGALALWFIATRMPPLRPRGEGALDLPSAMLLLLGLVPLVLGLQLDKRAFPWGDPVTIGLFAGAAVMLGAFALRSLRVPSPILDLGLFRNRVFGTSIAALILIGGSFLVIVIFLPLFMVNVVGVSATSAGVTMIPLSLGVTFGSVLAGQLVSRYGHYRLLLLIGGAILFVGVLLLAGMTADTPYWRITAYMIVCGVGLGPGMPLYTLAIQNAVDVRKIGQATSASQFFRQIGGTVGVAVMGTVFATGLTASLASVSLPGAPALASAGGAGGGVMGAAGEASGAVERAVSAEFDAIAAAVRAGDRAALTEALAVSQLPERARAAVGAGAMSAMDDPRAMDGFLAGLRARFERYGAQLAATVASALEAAFAEAITRVYRYTLVPVALGWLVTLFVPELPLRRTLEGTGGTRAD